MVAPHVRLFVCHGRNFAIWQLALKLRDFANWQPSSFNSDYCVFPECALLRLSPQVLKQEGDSATMIPSENYSNVGGWPKITKIA